MKNSIKALLVSTLALTTLHSPAFAVGLGETVFKQAPLSQIEKDVLKISETSEFQLIRSVDSPSLVVLVQQLQEMKITNDRLSQQLSNQHEQATVVKMLLPILIEIKQLLFQIERRG